MKNPPDPDLGVKDEIAELGLSVAEAAKGLGVARRQLCRLVGGECGISPEKAVRLEMAIGSTADFWLRLQANYDLAQIRNRRDPLDVKRLAKPSVA